MKYTAIAAFAALITVGCANAEPPREAREGAIFISSIETDADAASVLEKLGAEAERICSDADKWPNWRLHQRVRKDNERCISEVVENGVRSIDNLRLTQLWEAL